MWEETGKIKGEKQNNWLEVHGNSPHEKLVWGNGNKENSIHLRCILEVVVS